ncbi:50S ribosomal protein L37Ae [Candidatus Burarchaeum australiense]|nr:50S ribosomal protein L37Ae [Candidatus Burarchaeum australiense]
MVKASVRGGAEMRKRAAAIDTQKRSRYACPSCGKVSLKRISNAVWKCKSCKAVFAGGANTPTTPMGQVGNKALENQQSAGKGSG